MQLTVSASANRGELHKSFGLPLDRPLLRPSCALPWVTPDALLLTGAFIFDVCSLVRVVHSFTVRW